MYVRNADRAVAVGFKCLAVFAVAVFLTLAGSGGVQAAPAAACDNGMKDVLNNNKDLASVMDKTLAAGVLSPPEPMAGLTCKDQALGVTARLGNIFSDRHDDEVPPANTEVFTPKLAYPDWGATDFLLFDLNDVIMPMLGNHMGSNYGGRLGSVLGTNKLSGKVNNLLYELREKVDRFGNPDNPIGKINKTIFEFSEKIEKIRTAISGVQKLAKLLNLPMPSPVIIGTVAALEAAQKVVEELMEQVQKGLNAIIQPLIAQAMGEIMSAKNDIECPNLDVYWGGGGSPTVKSITGNGATSDAPYMPTSQALSGAYAKRLGGAAASVFQSTWNTDAVARALNDRTNGALSGPGRSDSWVAPPVFRGNVTPEEVIEQMKAQAR